MNLLGVSSIVGAVGKIADDLFTTEQERRELDLKEKELDQRIDLAQIDVNKAEANHSSVFVSGARPSILWIGAAAMAWTFIIHPILIWVWAFLQAVGWISVSIPPPPTLETDTLWVVVSGVLGLGGFRTFEKTKGVAR
jgi:hypothetical protein